MGVASFWPESINYVEFYRNDELVYIAYDDPFLVYFTRTWAQEPIDIEPGTIWKALVYLVNGEILEYKGEVL